MFSMAQLIDITQSLEQDLDAWAELTVTVGQYQDSFCTNQADT